MNIDVREHENWHIYFHHNIVCKVIGKADEWNDEPLREKAWIAVNDYLQDIWNNKGDIHKFELSSCVMKKLHPAEIELLKSGFWFDTEMNFGHIGYIHQSSPYRFYKRGKDEASFFIEYKRINGKGFLKFNGLAFRYNDHYQKGFPSVEEIKELV